jgi:O-antigen/teichoic acid export membrane protein
MGETPIANEQRSSSDDDPNRHFSTEHLKDDLGRRSARAGAVTLGSQIAKFVISTASTIVLARLLTPQDYGLIGMVAILVNFVIMFQYMGLSTATIQWPELNHQQVSTLFWINMGMSTIIMLVMAALSPLVAWFYQEPRLIGITIGYAIAILITGLEIQHEALLNRQMRFFVLAAIDLASLLIGIGAALVSAWYGAGYWAIVINQLVMAVARAVGVWSACKWRPGLPVRGAGVRPMLSYGGNFTGTNLMIYFSRNLDNTLIGKFWGAQQLGLYAKAYQILLLPIQQISSPVANVAMPALSRLADSPERFRKAYLNIIEKLAMITMPGVVFMIATSDWLVVFLLGPQWIETGRIFMLLGIAAIIQPVSRTCWWLFATQGRAREMFHWSLISGGIAIVSIIAGLPWGALGVAASYAVTDLLLYTPLLFWYVGRRGAIRASDFYRTIAPSVCASVCALIVLAVSRQWLAMIHPAILRLGIAFAITAVVSLIVFAVLPTGRLAIQNFKEIFLLLLKNKKSESAA